MKKSGKDSSFADTIRISQPLGIGTGPGREASIENHLDTTAACAAIMHAHPVHCLTCERAPCQVNAIAQDTTCKHDASLSMCNRCQATCRACSSMSLIPRRLVQQILTMNDLLGELLVIEALTDTACQIPLSGPGCLDHHKMTAFVPLCNPRWQSLPPGWLQSLPPDLVVRMPQDA